MPALTARPEKKTSVSGILLERKPLLIFTARRVKPVVLQSWPIAVSTAALPGVSWKTALWKATGDAETNDTQTTSRSKSGRAKVPVKQPTVSKCSERTAKKRKTR